MAEINTVTKETTKNKLKEPKKFKVILLNDDFTPMDFVIAVLVAIFKHNEADAMKLMLQIHNEGSAVAGIYNHEIAEQKGLETTNVARENGHPLQVKVEAE